MRPNFLDGLLTDPLSGEKLFPDSSGISYSTADGKVSYPVSGSIPIILTGKQDNSETALHSEYGSVFNYPDHYRKDAVLDDYSESNLPGVTRNEVKRLREAICREIAGKKGNIVLDAGCGNGWASKLLVPKGLKVISMDISLANPARAIAELPHEDHAGLTADVFFIPIKDNSVDYIIASEIIEHVTNPALLVNSLLRVLKPGGKLIITTPYNEKIEYSLCVHCNRPTPKSAHLHSFNEKNIAEVLPADGVKFKIELLVNRQLSKIRSYVLLGLLPYYFWRLIDRLFNRLTGKPTRMKVVVEKLL